jgi:tRNA threonylcarbamoyl adenosine modification protein YeaZ
VLVLVVDTSSAAVTSALAAVDADGVQLLAERVTINARAHGELLAPQIAACLAEAGSAAGDIGAIVAGLGPGPFTGLRVGLVTASVMADTLGIPAYGVCSLDGIAGALTTAGEADERPLLVATDARRKEVYWARYLRGRRVEGPSVSRPQDISEGAAVASGAGARMYRDVFGVPLLDRDYPAPLALVEAAMPRLVSRAPHETLSPLYLRRPDAVPATATKPVTQ